VKSRGLLQEPRWQIILRVLHSRQTRQ